MCATPRTRHAPSTFGRRASSPLTRCAAILATALLVACRSDDLTVPAGRPPAPGDARPVLTGGAGVDIFPTVAPGEIQPTGVAIGLNNAAQITGSAFGLITPDDYKPFRWTAATGAVQLVGCCDTEWGNDINEAGVVVGTAQTNGLTGSRGF